MLTFAIVSLLLGVFAAATVSLVWWKSIHPAFLLTGFLVSLLTTMAAAFFRMTDAPASPSLSLPQDENSPSSSYPPSVEIIWNNQQLLQTLFNAIPNGIMIVDRNMTILFVNEWIQQQNPSHSLIGRKCFEAFQQREKPCPWCPTIQTLKDGSQHINTFGVTTNAGKEIWVELTAFPVLDDAGEIISVIEYVRDITQWKQTEDERFRLATAIQQVAESIVITDRHGAIQYVNPAFEAVTGYSREEAVGRNPRILKSGRHNDTFYKTMWNTLLAGRVWYGHIVNRKKNGDLYEEEVSISPVLDTKGIITNFVAVKRDVTEEIQLEQQLRQAQKMESIGTLAGGIAHDFNNILFPIIGYTEMTLDDLPEDSLGQRNLQEVLRAANRAQELIQQILTFSRSEEQEKKPLRIHLIVKEALKLLQSTLPSTIEIIQDIAPCPPVLAEPTRIHQIVMNLCTNAFHAMETGGQLVVRLDESLVEPDDLHLNFGLQRETGVRLTVKDTGSGIDRFTLNRIFEPYFTTKAQGKGTGMGLAMVHGIIKSYGGGIKVDSTPDRGTTFTIYFPQIETGETHLDVQEHFISEPANEHILVVDDEVAIVGMIRQMLERIGYHITTRSSSVEALAAFRAQPHRYDLLITDQTMPHLTGRELARQVMAIRPDMPVILCTGFSDIVTEEDAKQIGIREYLLKPIISRQMATAIRRALGKDRERVPQAKVDMM